MKLREVAIINAGYPFRESIVESTEPNALVVQMKDISSTGNVNWFGCVNTTLTGKRSPQWLKPGDILFSARGSRNYATQIDSDILEKKLQAVAAPHFFVLSVENNCLLPAYLTWFLNQYPCQSYFEKNAEGSFAKSIRRSVLEETPIAIPSLEKQHIIVNLVNILKKERFLLEKMMHNSEQFLNSIAHNLLTNF